MNNRSRSSRPRTPIVDPVLLRASGEGTASFQRRFAVQFSPDFYRPTTFGLTISSIGLGTYLGDATEANDAAYEAAIGRAIALGINLIDTAINYRNQRSEQAVGAALQQAIASGAAARQELVVCSKGGYIPLDRSPPATRDEYRDYVKREFLDQQILRADEIVAGGHSLAPRFLRYCLAKSRQNLGLRTIDTYYLHNPEQQLGSVAREDFLQRLRGAFAMLEEAAQRGEIGVYGCATWDGLRVPPDHKSHLSLEALVGVAREVGGDGHHLRMIQLPINLAMTEAVREATQSLGGKLMTPLAAASELGLTVAASATLMQAKLTSGLPEALRDPFPRCSTDAQRAIEFVRSMPGVTTALVGMKQLEHVDDNLGAVRIARPT
jgi:aryl-alcohol dehydrogenase-like predicted oxidoreductase